MKTTVLSRIDAFFGDLSRARAAVETYERLDAMGDARLAARGLKRSEIATTAFLQAFGR